MNLRVLILSAFAANTAAAAALAQPVHSVDWDDADSGALNDIDFRLADVDAPETRPVGSRGGAKCEAERAAGRAALSWLKKPLEGATLTITGRDKVLDPYGRVVVTLSVDGADLGELGIIAGHYKPYIFDGRKALMKKPLWC